MRSADRQNQPQRETVQAAWGNDDILRLQRDLDGLYQQQTDAVEKMAGAKATLEFGSDRRKEALSDAVFAIRQKDPETSNADAEHRARNSQGYKQRMEQLYRDECTAEAVVQNWAIIKDRIEVLRSYLSLENAKLRIL